MSRGVLRFNYHISDYFPLGKKNYIDFTSCATVGKLLELSESANGKIIAPSSWGF